MIVGFSPFLAVETSSLDGLKRHFTFCCPHCHSNSAVKLSYNGLNKSLHFYEGHFMCNSCGHSSYKGEPFYYASDCFKALKISNCVQLTFDF